MINVLLAMAIMTPFPSGIARPAPGLHHDNPVNRAATVLTADTVDRAAVERALTGLAGAIGRADMKLLEPHLDSAFRTGTFEGPMARQVMSQVLAMRHLKAESARLDSIVRSGGGWQVHATMVSQGSSKPFTAVVSNAGRFVEINLFSVSAPAAGVRVPEGSGISLGPMDGAAAPGMMTDARDPALAAGLLKRLEDDQRYRGLGPDMGGKAELQAELDRANMAWLDSVVARRGWPGKSLVGLHASSAAFSILQHAPQADQERHLPLVRAAAAAGEVPGMHLALLEDRVLVRQGRKQIYGTQSRCGPGSADCAVLPIEDPANVNARRASVGLPPLPGA